MLTVMKMMRMTMASTFPSSTEEEEAGLEEAPRASNPANDDDWIPASPESSRADSVPPSYAEGADDGDGDDDPDWGENGDDDRGGRGRGKGKDKEKEDAETEMEAESARPSKLPPSLPSPSRSSSSLPSSRPSSSRASSLSSFSCRIFLTRYSSILLNSPSGLLFSTFSLSLSQSFRAFCSHSFSCTSFSYSFGRAISSFSHSSTACCRPSGSVVDSTSFATFATLGATLLAPIPSGSSDSPCLLQPIPSTESMSYYYFALPLAPASSSSSSVPSFSASTVLSASLSAYFLLHLLPHSSLPFDMSLSFRLTALPSSSVIAGWLLLPVSFLGCLRCLTISFSFPFLAHLHLLVLFSFLLYFHHHHLLQPRCVCIQSNRSCCFACA